MATCDGDPEHHSETVPFSEEELAPYLGSDLALDQGECDAACDDETGWSCDSFTMYANGSADLVCGADLYCG